MIVRFHDRFRSNGNQALALKIEALGTIALSKIEHFFPNICFTEENLAELTSY